MHAEPQAARGSALRIVIAGGGTGGHVYPGLAIADELRRMEPDATIVFVGSRGHIEERIVPASGYVLRTIWISGFRRALTLATLLFPVKLAVALVQSFVLLRTVRPNIAVGTGGYVCGPVLYAATVLGIPTLIQEQNSYPGVTTRILAPQVDQVHITFDSTRRFLKRADNVRLSGNPTRSSLGAASRTEAAGFFGIDPLRKTLLVFGGSQGAVGINSAVLIALPGILATGAQMIWQTGERDYERITGNAEVRDATGRGVLRIHRYLEKMGEAYAASDLVLCRAGATTLAELTCVGKPSVLIPLPTAAANHQTANARSMEEAGASVMVPESEAENRLLTVLTMLLNDPVRRHEMGEKAQKLGRPDAAHVLASAVIELANR